MVLIPIQNEYFFSQEITIESVVYKFNFAWNDNGKYWSVGIQDSTDIEIVSSIKLVFNVPLTAQYRGRGLPIGTFFCFGDDEKIVEDGLGKTSYFAYSPVGDADLV